MSTFAAQRTPGHQPRSLLARRAVAFCGAQAEVLGSSRSERLEVGFFLCLQISEATFLFGTRETTNFRVHPKLKKTHTACLNSDLQGRGAYADAWKLLKPRIKLHPSPGSANKDYWETKRASDPEHKQFTRKQVIE